MICLEFELRPIEETLWTANRTIRRHVSRLIGPGPREESLQTQAQETKIQWDRIASAGFENDRATENR
jgi:hypothetical protein